MLHKSGSYIHWNMHRNRYRKFRQKYSAEVLHLSGIKYFVFDAGRTGKPKLISKMVCFLTLTYISLSTSCGGLPRHHSFMLYTYSMFQIICREKPAPQLGVPLQLRISLKPLNYQFSLKYDCSNFNSQLVVGGWWCSPVDQGEIRARDYRNFSFQQIVD